MVGRLAHTHDMSEEPDGTNPLLFTAVFLIGIVALVALLYGLAWLMWAGK
jgi:hypothetical protein